MNTADYVQVIPFTIVPETDPILKEAMPTFTEWGNTAVGIATELARQMLHRNGLGLAANQLGMRARAFAMRTDPVQVCFNPVIVDASTELVALEEGCLSWPGLAVMVKRPKDIRVRFADVNGVVDTHKYTGMTARIFQHELDHLNGINFIDRAGPMVKQRALDKWKRKLKPKADLMRKLTAPKPPKFTVTTTETHP